jgi:hypothetical protein
MKQLTVEEAYAAMFAFLENLYTLNQSEELGAMLGSMSLLPNGTPADAAIWDEWLVAVEKSMSRSVRVNMELK